jgi:hypothetical protein
MVTAYSNSRLAASRGLRHFSARPKRCCRSLRPRGLWGSAKDPDWKLDESLLIEACDELHRSSDIGDRLWDGLWPRFSDEALVEILLLAGFYRTVSYLTNALRIPLESFAARFPI